MCVSVRSLRWHWFFIFLHTSTGMADDGRKCVVLEGSFSSDYNNGYARAAGVRSVARITHFMSHLNHSSKQTENKAPRLSHRNLGKSKRAMVASKKINDYTGITGVGASMHTLTKKKRRVHRTACPLPAKFILPLECTRALLNRSTLDAQTPIQ